MNDAQPKLSKNQMKKLLKKQRRDEAKAASKAASKTGSRPSASAAAEPVDEEDYAALRGRDLRQLEEAGFKAYQYTYSTDYPSKGDAEYTKLDFDTFTQKYTDLPNETEVETDLYYSIGRVNRLRRSGGKLLFVDIRIGGKVLQMKINRMTYLDGEDSTEREARFVLFRSVIRVGDIWGFAGHVGKTKVGELSLYIHQMRMLTPCVRVLPPATKTIDYDKYNQLIQKVVEVWFDQS